MIQPFDPSPVLLFIIIAIVVCGIMKNKDNNGPN